VGGDRNLNRLRFVLRFGRAVKTLGTLRMNARQRINGMMTDRAAIAIGIIDLGVAVIGEHHGHLVCEHAGGSFYELGQTVLRPNRIGEPRRWTINTHDR
jgi:hypothetical protein